MQRYLAFLAIAFFATLPQGFMIETNSNQSNSIAIVICNAQGEFDAFMDINGNISFAKDNKSSKNHDKNQTDTSQHCSFAGFANSGIVHSPQNFAKTEFFVPQRTILADYSVTIGHGLAAPPPPKTGPPSII